ncbi:MAG: hypothetical protein KBC95_00500 [Candidatus Peribacteraceae bacterium]|nr:hypothetical protein [Candidatus Peribacteraceae bacterium]
MPESTQGPPEAATERERQLQERSAARVSQARHDVMQHAQKLLRLDEPIFHRSVVASGDLSDDETLYRAFQQVGTLGHPDAVRFVMAHIDRLAQFLDDPAKSQTAVDVLVNLGISRGEQDAEVAAIVTDLLLPRLEAGTSDHMIDLLLPVFLNGTPYQRRKVLATLAPQWRGLLRYPIPYDSRTHTFVQCLYSEHADVRQATTAVLREVLPPDLDAAALRRLWEDTRENSWHWITDNINRILQLEQLRPGEHVPGTLHDRFGIVHFGRYAPELLLQQFDERDAHRPYALVAGAHSDHNHALQNSRYIGTLAAELKKQGILTRIIEFHSPESLCEQTGKLRSRYLLEAPAGEGHAAVAAVFDVHGNTHGMYPGFNQRHIGVEDIDAEVGAALQGCLEPGAWIVLNSCSTGKADNGVAAAFSRLGFSAVGPNRNTSAESIKVETDDHARVRLRPQYAHGKEGIAQTFVAGKRITEA